MKNTIQSTFALLLLTAAPFAIACDYPQRADVPNGATATKDDMLAGQTAVKDYVAAMESYLACIDQEEKETVATMADLSDEEKASREAAFTKKYNAAVEEMQLVAAQFNEEVRTYKTRSE